MTYKTPELEELINTLKTVPGVSFTTEPMMDANFGDPDEDTIIFMQVNPMLVKEFLTIMRNSLLYFTIWSLELELHGDVYKDKKNEFNFRLRTRFFRKELENHLADYEIQGTGKYETLDIQEYKTRIIKNLTESLKKEVK